MKKLIFIIPVLLTLPSYADIASNANSATCDSGTIGATSGSTGLEANWNANTITINWYNGNTKITTNTCSYDGAVTIPATPTKAGYTFNGWKIKGAQSQSPTSTCYEIENETACNSSVLGCLWDDDEGGCYPRPTIHACAQIPDADVCIDNPDCFWFDEECVQANDCSAITEQGYCNGAVWSDKIHYGTCIWTQRGCVKDGGGGGA